MVSPAKPKLNPDWVRQKVIEEIVNNEEGYVKNLRDVIDVRYLIFKFTLFLDGFNLIRLIVRNQTIVN